MNDRELLELAAKAAGINGRWLELDAEFKLDSPSISDGTKRYLWRPLQDDGDALRLAVKIELQLRLRHSENEVSAYGSPEGRVDEGVRGDANAATRRAIVRAAAAIGGAMQ